LDADQQSLLLLGAISGAAGPTIISEFGSNDIDQRSLVEELGPHKLLDEEAGVSRRSSKSSA